MDNASLIAFVVCLFGAGLVTTGIASDSGPRATLALGIGWIVLSNLVALVGHFTGTPAIIAAALGGLIVGVMAVLAVALNRWLPK